MIVSSFPTASRSRIELDRVRKKSGRNSGHGGAGLRSRLPGWPVESLFQHVDDQAGRALGFQFGEQADQSPGNRGAILDKPGQRLIDSRLEGRVAVQPCLGRRAPCARRSRPTNAAPGSVSAIRMASRVLPLPSGPTMWFSERMSCNSNRSPPRATEGRARR